MRRFVRSSIQRSPLTSAEAKITTALVNLWFHHKNGEGLIRPGREKVAKRARVSVRTVASCLLMLRENNVLKIVSHGNGGWHTATRYRLDIIALLELCGHKFPAEFNGELHTLSGRDCTHFAHAHREKIAHGYILRSDDVFSSEGFSSREENVVMFAPRKEAQS